MANPQVTVADGGAAAAAISDGATTRVTPGNTVTIALNSSTGVARWSLYEDGIGLLAGGSGGPAGSAIGKGKSYSVGSDGPFTVTWQLPNVDCQIPIYSSVLDGSTSNEAHDRIILDCRYLNKVTPVHLARGVCTSNMSISAFVGVSGGTAQDGVTYAQGERVLLAGQTTTSQNGIYEVGVVAAGTAPLTRVADFYTGDVVRSGVICEVSEGTINANTRWKITTTGAITVGTTNHNWYPAIIRGTVALVAGTTTISCPVLSATLTAVAIHRRIANTSNLTVGGYHPTTGGATGYTAGFGTGAIVVEACVGAGTINNADISTIIYAVMNY